MGHVEPPPTQGSADNSPNASAPLRVDAPPASLLCRCSRNTFSTVQTPRPPATGTQEASLAVDRRTTFLPPIAVLLKRQLIAERLRRKQLNTTAVWQPFLA